MLLLLPKFVDLLTIKIRKYIFIDHIIDLIVSNLYAYSS